MKIIAILFLVCLVRTLSYGQINEIKIEKDRIGIINYIKFFSPQSSEIDNEKEPISTLAFFKKYLNTSVYDEFVKEPQHNKCDNYIHEHYNQFYKGIKVDAGGYNFHYFKGRIYLAHGHYIKINDLDINPTISIEMAVNKFIEYKNIAKDSVVDFLSALLIKEINLPSKESNAIPKLVYRIYLLANDAHNDEVGYVDAHNGEVVATENRAFDYSATGTFETRYNSTKYATTQFYNGKYNLCDSSRSTSGGPIIHTWNLNGDIYFTHAVELTDENNYWSSDEYQYNEDDMGLDIHWALQEIVDYLKDVHNINSFDDNGYKIDAYFHIGSSNYYKDNAGYDPYYKVLYFGDGAVLYKPISSIDAIAHEYGHGITDFQIGWALSGDPLAFHEGLSDIWAVILENRISPNSIWRMGEEITLNYSCLRNIADPDGNNPKDIIADTYQSTYYNSSSDPHIRGGVFSHWFYLLVNGGSGTNGIANDYKVFGIGMDAAEDLIVYSVMNDYMDNTSTYPQLRTAMVNAAEARFGVNSLESMQVANAWYAVGVGDQPAQVSYSGPSFVCQSGAEFTVSNLPSGATISWSCSDNITLLSSQDSNPGEFESNYNGYGWIRATITSNSEQYNLGTKNVWSGVPLSPDFIYAFQNPPCVGSSHYFFNDPGNYDLIGYHWYIQSDYYSYIYNYQLTAYVDSPYSQYITLSVNAENQCGFSDMYYSDPILIESCGYKMAISPNPATDRLKIELSNNSVENVQLEIYNSQGVKIISTPMTGNEKTIDISKLQKGIYYISVFSNSKGKSKINTERFIKD